MKIQVLPEFANLFYNSQMMSSNIKDYSII